MAISEIKIQMVIDNYFKSECDTNTSIRQAFEKGFRIGAEKGASMNSPRKWISCEERLPEDGECVLAWAGGSVDVVRFEMGISQETREKMKKGEIPDPIEYVWCLADGYTPQKRSDAYCRSDEGWNNQKPYCWVHAPMEYFGQDVKAWMPLPESYRG